jgi:hypothetical protein
VSCLQTAAAFAVIIFSPGDSGPVEQICPVLAGVLIGGRYSLQSQFQQAQSGSKE